MRRVGPVFLGFATIATGVGVLLGRFDAPEASAASPKMQQFSGTISSVDQPSEAVIVERRLWGVAIGQPTKVLLDAHTELQAADGRALEMNHLEAGQQVTVNYYDDSGRPVARSITVKDTAPGVTAASEETTMNLPASPVGPSNLTDVPAPTPEATPSQEQPSMLPQDL